METIIYTMPIDEFTELIKKCIRDELKERSSVKPDTDLLKIADLIKLFGVSKVTIHKWCKSGVLPYHRIASRVYFKKSEVLESLSNINKRKKP